MGFSGTTDGYRLPQWVGTDKPTFTGDLNKAMITVDTVLGKNEDVAIKASNLAAATSAQVTDVTNNVNSKVTALESSVDSKVTALGSSVDSKIETAMGEINTSVSKSLSDQNSSINTTVTNLSKSVDDSAKSLRDDMAKAIAGVPSKYLIDIVGDYGADPTGVADTTPIFAKINVDNPDGCCIFFRSGTYLFNDTIQVVGSTRLVGSGSVRSSSAGIAEYEHGGTFLDFRTPGNRGQCISFDTWGTCNIEHLTIGTKGGSACAPFIKGNRKVLIIEDVSFSGSPNVINDSCQQDAIILGSEGSIFGGYGTRIDNVTFSRIRTCIKMGPGCNGTLVSNIVVTQTCGTSDNDMGAIILDGGSDQCTSNWIMNVVAEPHAYKYLVSLGNARNNRFDNLQTWDTGWMDPKRFEHAIRFLSPNAHDNVFNNVWLDGMSWDSLSTDNKHLAWHNVTNQGNKRSLPFMTDQERNDNNSAPIGSMCLAEADGSVWINTGNVWKRIVTQ